MASPIIPPYEPMPDVRDLSEASAKRIGLEIYLSTR